MFWSILFSILFISTSTASSAGLVILDGNKDTSFPYCGTKDAPPFAQPGDGGRRTCGIAKSRNYRPKHRGIGFEILDLESEACFVPDDAYRLLDEVIDDVKSRLRLAKWSLNRNSKVAQILSIGRTTSDVLTEKGFGLYIPTETLGDALIARNKAGESPRHIFDCDTASMILLTVAESLSAPASLVEITMPSGNQHNYVRWQLSQASTIDWDMNARSQCTTPSNVRGYQGRGLSRDQTISYALTLRADLWERENLYLRAAADYRKAIRLFPERPAAYNSFAWLVATKEFPERIKFKDEALAAANRAVALKRTPDYLDTLACAHAYVGEFDRAESYEKEAVEEAPSNSQISQHLEQFKARNHKDCTGTE